MFGIVTIFVYMCYIIVSHYLAQRISGQSRNFPTILRISFSVMKWYLPHLADPLIIRMIAGSPLSMRNWFARNGSSLQQTLPTTKPLCADAILDRMILCLRHSSQPCRQNTSRTGIFDFSTSL